MLRRAAPWLLLLLLAPPVILGREVPLLLQPRFELRLAEAGQPLRISRQVSAEATVRLFLELYRKAGPRVGCRLVEPSVLLTLSGARGLTAWNGRWDGATTEDLACLEELDRLLVPQGISLRPASTFLEGDPQVQVVNLAGVERVTHRTRMPGTIPFDAASGWQGYHDWCGKQWRSYQQGGPVSGQGVHVFYGLLLGYPDRAVVGYLGSGKPRGELCIGAFIPYANQYECGVPEYVFLPADLDDPGIQANLAEWGTLLRECYEHPDMRRIDADPAFRHARRVALLAKPRHPSMGWWSDERGRLGIWSRQQWDSRRLSRGSPNSLHERVLRACARDLERALQERAANAHLLEICRDEAKRQEVACLFDVSTLMQWLQRGSLEADGPARRLYEAARVGRPDLLPRPRRGK